MIIFEGQISGKCKKNVLRREAKISFFGGLITSILFSIPTIVLAFKMDWIVLLFFLVLIPLPFLAAIPPKEKYYPMIFPSKVTINTQTGEITTQSSQFFVESSIAEVVKVLDKGEWYHIYVKGKDGRFICQKDLLINGTLEEFENIFKDYIISDFA